MTDHYCCWVGRSFTCTSSFSSFSHLLEERLEVVVEPELEHGVGHVPHERGLVPREEAWQALGPPDLLDPAQQARDHARLLWCVGVGVCGGRGEGIDGWYTRRLYVVCVWVGLNEGRADLEALLEELPGDHHHGARDEGARRADEVRVGVHGRGQQRRHQLLARLVRREL